MSSVCDECLYNKMPLEIAEECLTCKKPLQEDAKRQPKVKKPKPVMKKEFRITDYLP